MKGKVKFFNMSKGYGFITGEDEKDYFVHMSKIENQAILKDNDEVEFEPSENERGLSAENVKKVSGEEDDSEEDNDNE